jgi:uncharacterized protein DUF1566
MSKIFVIAYLLLILSALSCQDSTSDESDAGPSGDSDADTDSDSDTDSDGDADTSSDDTEYSIWCDPNTDLCWQDPQRQAFNHDDIGLLAKDAIDYCKDLTIGGYDDWRLPTINELRTIVLGSEDCQTDGACPVVTGAEKQDGWDLNCIGSAMWEGPGANGCYMKKALTGSCDKEDPFSADHHLETWAIDEASDDERWIASVLFEIGGIAYNHICSYGDVRCVRDGPGDPILCDQSEECSPGETTSCSCDGYQQPNGIRVCNDAGDCFSPCKCLGHVKNPDITPECENDICPDSDKIELTIDLPNVPDTEPHQVLAFFYDAKSWAYPPVGPPDGGTHYNQIVNPGMPPYKMTIPGCTYYGEYLLEGDYQLFVLVQNTAKFPPIPECGDYTWGEGGEPVTFPLEDDKHDGDVVRMEITVDPVCGCPADKPFECEGGYCVADETTCCPAPKIYLCDDGVTCVEDFSECPFCAGDQPIPDDEEVFSCRYNSTYTNGNCADFPICEGWSTEEQVTEFCNTLDGIKKPSLEVSTGESCLVEKAMGNKPVRCRMKGDAKNFWAYGATNPICSMFMGGVGETGPFCEGYCN